MDINPVDDGHCLVIPHAHFRTVPEMPPELFGRVAACAARVARAVDEVLRPGGLSLVQANSAAAGQSVPHVHVHVLPRRAGDNLPLNWHRGRAGAATRDGARLAAVAARLRARLGGS
jgi:histidine triad (HIT) family protein